jgi:zinc/manganese transport system permease protein
MMLPAAASRFWANRVGPMCPLAIVFAKASSIAGLLSSYHASLPSGPAIILTAGAIYLLSALVGRKGVLRSVLTPSRHKTA